MTQAVYIMILGGIGKAWATNQYGIFSRMKKTIRPYIRYKQ